MNEISLTKKHRVKERHPRISLKSILFNAYDDDNLYKLYNLKTYQIEYADNSILSELKRYQIIGEMMSH